MLLKDWTTTAQTLHEIDLTLLGVTSLTLGLALMGTLAFSRRLTRPLRDLATVAGEIAQGQWHGHVPSRGPIETRRMADAFNHMTKVLGHWHDQVEARTEELNVAYQRFRAITDSASDAIVSVDIHGDIVFWNPRAEVVFGYSQREALHQPLSMLVPKGLRTGYESAFAQVVAGTSQWLGRTVECSAMRRDGSMIPVELSLSTWAAMSNVFYTGIIRDMTERHQAAAALKEREEQLRQAQKMEAVGRLAGGVAHDFNNLLTAILGYSDLLLDELPANDPTRRQITEIQKAGRNAATLTRDLLAFSRKQVLQPVIVDLNAVVSNIDSLLRRLVGEHIEIVVEQDAALRRVKADPGQLSQVLLNLAVNARDAMADGGRLTISTRNRSETSSEDNDVLLTVTDTGCGMTEAVREHIFEPFFTTKGVGHGTGLGLATVYGIVEQSGGRIWVDRVLQATARRSRLHFRRPTPR